MEVYFYFRVNEDVSGKSLPVQESDERLIGRVRASDEAAFKFLFEKYQPILFRSVLHSLRDADASHDIVQETFVRVWIHRASLKPNLPLLAFLFRISRNLVRDCAKHHAVRQKHEANIPHPSPSIGDDPEEFLQLSMLEEKLSEVVRKRLPAKCREVFLLSRMEQLSNAEIGAHLGLSVKTVENHITRALKILRRHLRQHTLTR